MPLYEFRCDGCGRQFEALLPYSRKSEAKCPDCGSESVQQLLSGFATGAGGGGGGGYAASGGSGFT